MSARAADCYQGQLALYITVVTLEWGGHEVEGPQSNELRLAEWLLTHYRKVQQEVN